MSGPSVTPDQSQSPTLEIGTQSLGSRWQTIITGGLLFSDIGRSAMHLESGSFWHLVFLGGMILCCLVMAFMLLGSKSVTALPGPNPKIASRYALATLTLRRKVVEPKKIAWVRVRYDGQKDLFLEAGTRGYQTTEVFRFPYDTGKSIPIAEGKSAQLAALWNVEDKGYRGLA